MDLQNQKFYLQVIYNEYMMEIQNILELQNYQIYKKYVVQYIDLY